jgi:hypothetical protein
MNIWTQDYLRKRFVSTLTSWQKRIDSDYHMAPRNVSYRITLAVLKTRFRYSGRLSRKQALLV